jgi:hypothetical protein
MKTRILTRGRDTNGTNSEAEDAAAVAEVTAAALEVEIEAAMVTAAAGADTADSSGEGTAERAAPAMATRGVEENITRMENRARIML